MRCGITALTIEMRRRAGLLVQRAAVDQTIETSVEGCKHEHKNCMQCTSLFKTIIILLLMKLPVIFTSVSLSPFIVSILFSRLTRRVFDLVSVPVEVSNSE